MAWATGISAVVGAQLREWRETDGLRQDEVARAARELGLSWTRATVAAIECGRRKVSLEELVALPFVVDWARATVDSPDGKRRVLIGGTRLAGSTPGRWHHLWGFMLTNTTAVELGPDVLLTNPGVNLKHLFSGKPVGDAATEHVPRDAVVVKKGARREVHRRVGTESDAEIKAAARLGASKTAITTAAQRLWGRTLTAERDARVAEAAGGDADSRLLQAIRGHTTRALLLELQRALKPARRTDK